MRVRKFTVLALTLALALLVSNAAWTRWQWQRQLDSGRAQMLSGLLSTSLTPRVIESPGVEAWQVSLLHDVAEGLPAAERDAFQALLTRSARQEQLPPGLAAIGEALHGAAPTFKEGQVNERELPRLAGAGTEVGGVQPLRRVEHLDVDGTTLVLTRRKSLFAAEGAGGLPRDLEHLAQHLTSLAQAWTAAPPALGVGGRGIIGVPRLTRVYAYVEDGSWMSAPFSDRGPTQDRAAQAAAVVAETHACQRRPGAPSLASNMIFEHFDYGEALGSQTLFTGIYPDVGGLGFVATVAVPVAYGEGGLKLIVAADLSVEVDLERLVQAADPSLELALTGALSPSPAPQWQPWTTLHGALPPDAPEPLRRAVWTRKQDELQNPDAWVAKRPLVHHRDSQGVLFAQQLDRHRWLIGRVDETPPRLPWVPMLLVPGALLGLLVWGQRRALAGEAERDEALAQLRQRRGVLDLLDLPLVVVDPNDDTVVHANAAAQRLDAKAGRVVHEHLVAGDPGSQEHYRNYQLLGGGRRRGYGVYLRGEEGDGDGERRFAIVRSVSLDAAQPGLGAEAHQRLGLICELDLDADLAVLLDDRVAATRSDERNKLGGILEHGVDTLARVLSRQLQREVEGGSTEHGASAQLHRWLADYMLTRIQVTQWVLERWGEAPATQRECILGPEHLCAGLERHEQIFALVRGDPRLRAQLHWNNGSLSLPGAQGGAIIQVELEWPARYRLMTPAEGLFGYMLGELLINAIKHGAPGQPLELEVGLEPARKQLSLCLRNVLAPERVEQTTGSHRKAYGGLAIVEELARLCGWGLSARTGAEFYEQRWTCPLTQERAEDASD